MMNVIIPYLGGLAPWHCADIPYVFRNVEMVPAHCTVYQYAKICTIMISKADRLYEKRKSVNKIFEMEPLHEIFCTDMIFAEECGMEERDDSRLLKLISESCKKKY